MKGFHVPSTRTTNSVRLILGSQYSLCVQLHQTSPSALRAETSSRYQLAPHAGVFRGARFSSLYEKRAPLKTPAWEARYQTDLPENQIWHTDEAGASLACYQSTLISETSFFSQWYFPSSGRSANEILWEIVASSPFPCPSRLRRSLARSRETPLTRPNRRACSQAKFVFSYLLACLKSGRHV